MAQKKTNKKPRQKTRRRRRGKGNFAPLLRLMSVVLTAVVIVAALTLFFKIEKITVSGNARYTADEIIAASGVLQGDNLILLDKYEIAREIYTKLPYITDVRINRALPDGLTVEITETKAALAIESGGAWWLVSASGKLLDTTEETGAQGYLLLRGMEPVEPALGKQLQTQGRLPVERLTELITRLSERGMLEKTTRIDASDEEKLVLHYDGRFEVELPYDADFAFKLDCLRAAVNELEPNETGIIRMTMKDEYEVRLIPFDRK